MLPRVLRGVIAAAFVVAAPLPVHAAGPSTHRCSMVLSALPVGAGSCGGIRPGALYTRPDGVGCTLGFIFKGSDGATYASSAGHCVWERSNLEPPVEKEQAWTDGSGSALTDPSGTQFGRFAYGVWTDARDFSLIRLNDGVQPDPSLCYFGGPTSLYTDHSGSPVFIKHFGNGYVFGDTIPARTGFTTDTTDPLWVYAFTASLPGDSGSAVMTADGQALGILVDLSIGTGGTTGITRLDASIAEAERYTGIHFTLQTAALNPDIARL